MPLLIDWHSHHTPPELVEKIASLGGRKPRIDDYDSPDFSKRVKEMDEAGLDLQLVCQASSPPPRPWCPCLYSQGERLFSSLARGR